MYGSLPNSEQLKVFWRAAKDTRKVIIATNIAETSITIPNIVYGMNLIKHWFYYLRSKENIPIIIIII